jgi:hypothetical protein
MIGPPAADLTAIEADITTLQATSPPGLVFLSSQTVSSASSVVFTGLSTLYDIYQFQITSMVASINNAALLMQMSVDDGATWKNTNNIWSWVYSFITGGAVAYGHNSISEGSNAYFRIGGVTNSTFGNNSEVMLYLSSGSGMNTLSWRSVDYYDAGGGVYQVIGSGNEESDGSPCNAVRFYFSTGNMATGRISMYGLRKS